MGLQAWIWVDYPIPQGALEVQSVGEGEVRVVVVTLPERNGPNLSDGEPSSGKGDEQGCDRCVFCEIRAVTLVFSITAFGGLQHE